jgi:single-strand DNA-binding protein
MKTNVNKVELVGFAGRDAEVKEIKKGIKLANFSLATSDGYRGKNGDWVDNTSWHNIVFWNDLADKAGDEIKKGSRVSLIGKINYRTYETQSGEKRNVTEIVATEFEIIPRES